jgi:MFS family permease
MLIDTRPLARYRDYRYFYVGQFASTLGSMMTYVALPYQVYRLTGSSMAVGAIGIVQLVPLLLTAFVGGAFADAMDRRKLLLAAQAGLALCAAVLALNAAGAAPRLWVVYLAAGLASGLNGFSRPATGAMIPRMVERADIPSVSALNAFSGTVASVGGPALAGLSIAAWGVSRTFLLETAGFAASMALLALMRPMPASGESKPVSLESIVEGLKYARSREELMGTYIVDIIAMIFGMPMALFPAVADGFGGAKVVGWLYSAPSAGALIATTFSAWTKGVRRHGAAVIWAAGVWGAAITLFGFSSSLPLSLFLLAVAGGADMISAIFRQTIWNGTIPDHLRGRLAGIEMVSYMTGPLLGNAESGLVAALAGTRFSIVSGGVLCVIGVAASVFWLPKFWTYEERRSES